MKLVRSKRRLLTTLLLLCCISWCTANEGLGSRNKYGFNLRETLTETKIPFELVDNLIVIPVQINKQVTVKAILDTGVRSFILYGKQYIHLDEMNFENSREVEVTGLGTGRNDQGVLSFGNNLEVEGVEGRGIAMVHVLDQIPFKLLRENNIEAIFGYQIFSRFVVEIDYQNLEITVKDPDYVAKTDYSFSLPIKIIDTKPYVEVELFNGKEKKTFNLLLDTGASSEILLYEQAFQGYLSSTYTSRKVQLGEGFNGLIVGKKGVMDSMNFLEMELQEVPFYAVSMKSTKNKFIKEKIIHGLIGANVLSKYKVTFDYVNHRAYFEKGESGATLLGS